MSLNEYPYRCNCGESGWIDLGDQLPNRYPCRACYSAIRAYREKRPLPTAWNPELFCINPDGSQFDREQSQHDAQQGKRFSGVPKDYPKTQVLKTAVSEQNGIIQAAKP